MVAAGKTFYEVLGVKRSASAQDIEQAYARLRDASHKDAAITDARRAAILKVAYTTLSETAARAEYDASIGNVPRPVRVIDLALWGAGALVLLGLAAFAYRWHENRTLAAPAEEGVNAARLVADLGRRIGRIEAALVSGEVRDLGLAVEVGSNEMAAVCGALPAGAALTVIQGKDVMRAEVAGAGSDDSVCILLVRGAREGVKLRAEIPPPRETLQALVMVGDRLQAREVTVGRVLPTQGGGAFTLEASEALPNGTAIFDMREQLVGLVMKPQGDAPGAVLALPARRITAQLAR